MTHLNVAVRVRPLLEREIELQSTPVVEILNSNVIAVTNLKVPEQNTGDSRERVRRFSFDYCFDTDATQEQVFKTVEDVIGNAVKKKYHSCILAYGQSSSGKTHTIMGMNEDPGMTPRLCERIFTYIGEIETEDDEKKVTVSYLEIYNEKVKDLLSSEENETTTLHANSLKVREHPKRGTYVQGLTQHQVSDSDELFDWLEKGNRKRRVSATSINQKSSRSHSVFTITCFGGVKLNLVDLAGSERTGSRSFNNSSTFREGANINKSLVALGNVIFALADQSSKNSKAFKKRYVPYRDSVLTWLLKDTLGGNSKTVMIATISPSSTCYNETINTLRFGHRAKQIISQPIVNEDPKQRTIRDLRAEIARLKELLCQHQVTSPQAHAEQASDAISKASVPQAPNGELVNTLRKTLDQSTNTESNLHTHCGSCLNIDFRDFIFGPFKTKLKEGLSGGLNEDFANDADTDSVFVEIIRRVFQTNLVNVNSKTFTASKFTVDAFLQGDSFSKIQQNIIDQINRSLFDYKTLATTQIFNIQNNIPEFKIYVCTSPDAINAKDRNVTQANPDATNPSYKEGDLNETQLAPTPPNPDSIKPTTAPIRTDSSKSRNVLTTAPTKTDVHRSAKGNVTTTDVNLDSEVLRTKTERLIPVMDVTSTVSKPKRPVVKLRRTFSVCSADMASKKTKIYGSYETLTTKSEKQAKSQPITTPLRKRSLDKSTSSIRSLPLKSSAESIPERTKSERGMVTELKGLSKIEAKVDSIRKIAVKPRAEIVAAVTQRLYAKVKKKEVATETDDVLREHKGTLARIRLQDITQRALRAYRRKHAETQTDVRPILRVKETSTDVQDLRVDLIEVKDANVSTPAVVNKDVAISCNFLDNFENLDFRHNLTFTNSCGTQVTNEDVGQGDGVSVKNIQPHNLSFTKYLRPHQREPKFELANHCTANPIYTSSVNINVSHNYINGNKTDSLSGDSLDEQNANALAFLPTPDLLSNHNSLEQHVQDGTTEEVHSTASADDNVNFAASNTIPEQVSADLLKKIGHSCIANCSITPKCKERVQSIRVAPGTYAPEICIVKEQCRSLQHHHQPKACRPKIRESADLREKPTPLEGPVVLKSIMKQNHSLEGTSDSESSSDVSLHTFQDVPDSLNYHFSKSVHFDEEPGKDRVFEAMANFLKEATNLMTNLTSVANKFDRDSSNRSYDLEVIVNDAGDLMGRVGKQRRRSKRRKTVKKDETACRTCTRRCADAASQTSPKKTSDRAMETNAEIPENKYEVLVRRACGRLDECANAFSKKQVASKDFGDESSLHKFPQPFSISTDWHSDHRFLQPEDSSLESCVTFSDYGSLPRQKVRHRSGHSPRAYLKELTSMRKQIIDSSREELINENHQNFG